MNDEQIIRVIKENDPEFKAAVEWLNQQPESNVKHITKLCSGVLVMEHAREGRVKKIFNAFLLGVLTGSVACFLYLIIRSYL
jgi:hypothetical protein